MDTCRVPFPWDETDWDHTTFDVARALIELRRTEAALQVGALRWIDATANAITYVREVLGHTMIVDLRRSPGNPRRLRLDTLTDRTVASGGVRFDTRIDDRVRVDTEQLHLPGSPGASVVSLATD